MSDLLGQGEQKSKHKRKRRKVKSIYFEGPKGKKTWTVASTKVLLITTDKNYGDVDDIGCSVLNLTDEEVKGKKQNLLNALQLNLTEIKSLERRTIGQS
ncbi:hypothetical protein QTP88_024569 [Uroleucon formosanum]